MIIIDLYHTQKIEVGGVGVSGGGPMSPELKTDNEEFGSPTPDIFDPNANSNVEDDYRFRLISLEN